jgi:hypothetical protein
LPDWSLSSFNAFKETTEFPTGLSKTFFLAITPQSLKSFSIPSTSAEQQGDYRGFFHAVSAEFISDAPSEQRVPNIPRHQRAPKHPAGYDGTFRIIDQLVWIDLFATTFLMAQDAETYWALAAQHPWGVYVGPTTGVRRRRWREMREVLGGLLEASKANSAGSVG